MKLKTSELRQFKQNASFIKTRGIIPILEFLKVENGTITKTSLECFMVQEIESKGSVLLNENILFNFLSQTKEPSIEITVKDKRVTIYDGSIRVSFPEEDISTFPSIPDEVEEKIHIGNDVFCAIKNAANFTDTMDLPDTRAHVFVGNGNVFGGNGFICYMERFKSKLPQISLAKDFATIVGKFNEADFSENEKYIFFNTYNCRFGFIKSMFKYTDLSKLMEFDKSHPRFELDKKELLSFSEMCVSSTKSKIVVADMSVKSNKLNLEMVDTDFEVNVNQSIPIGDGNMGEPFSFNASLMITMLKNIPDDELVFYRKDKSLIITGESGFVSIIQQITK